VSGVLGKFATKSDTYLRFMVFILSKVRDSYDGEQFTMKSDISKTFEEEFL
jgi:hypothetical protein